MNVDLAHRRKQDKYRFILLLNHYYSEICDEDGRLNRVAILTTKQLYQYQDDAKLKIYKSALYEGSFLMIRDSDGKDRDMLGRQLCKYYDEKSC